MYLVSCRASRYALRLETTYSLCVRLHSSGMRPDIGIPNGNRDDIEQISDTINLVDGSWLRTDDVVRATCTRGARATAICVISNAEYTRSLSTASTTAIILLYLLYCLYGCVPSLYHRTGMYWAAYCWNVQKKSCRLKNKKSSWRSSTNTFSTVSGKTKSGLLLYTSAAYDWCTYQLSLE